MIKKRRDQPGITEKDFAGLVDDGFKAPPKRRRVGGQQPEPLPESVVKQPESEGYAVGRSKSEARFHAAMCRCIGVKPGLLDKRQTEFLKSFDEHMREFAKETGIELRDD